MGFVGGIEPKKPRKPIEIITSVLQVGKHMVKCVMERETNDGLM